MIIWLLDSDFLSPNSNLTVSKKFSAPCRYPIFSSIFRGIFEKILKEKSVFPKRTDNKISFLSKIFKGKAEDSCDPFEKEKFSQREKIKFSKKRRIFSIDFFWKFFLLKEKVLLKTLIEKEFYWVQITNRMNFFNKSTCKSSSWNGKFLFNWQPPIYHKSNNIRQSCHVFI